MCVLSLALHIGFARCSFISLYLSCSKFTQKCIFRGTYIVESRRIEEYCRTRISENPRADKTRIEKPKRIGFKISILWFSDRQKHEDSCTDRSVARNDTYSLPVLTGSRSLANLLRVYMHAQFSFTIMRDAAPFRGVSK